MLPERHPIQFHVDGHIAIARVNGALRQSKPADVFAFIISEGASVKMAIEGKERVLYPGSFIGVLPGQRCATEKPEGGSEFLVTYVDRVFAERLLLDLFRHTHIRFSEDPVAIENDISLLLGALIRGLEKPHEVSSFIMKTTATLLVARLFLISVSENPADGERKPKSGNIQNAMRFIHENYYQECSVEEVASSAHISIYHFIRVFKKETGLTPHEYLLRVRLDAAKELLGSSEHQMKEIGYLCGFSDAGSFSRVFRKRTGIPPLSYRRAILLNNTAALALS
jgi:AraC family transcriptional regulator